MTEPLEIRRKRLLFRSWHRGTREADLLFGSFADRHLAGFGADQLDIYERLIEESDPDLWDWIIGAAEPPQEHSTEIMSLLRNFRFTG